jgi:hypothetical protein
MNRKGNDPVTVGASLDPATFTEEPDRASFFERNTEPRKEIIEGMIRGQQLVAFAGPFGTGKSPVLADLAMTLLMASPGVGVRSSGDPLFTLIWRLPALSIGQTCKTSRPVSVCQCRLCRKNWMCTWSTTAWRKQARRYCSKRSNRIPMRVCVS